jgi:endoglucanase
MTPHCYKRAIIFFYRVVASFWLWAMPAAGLATNPLAGMEFYVDPDSQAAQQIRDWGDQYPTQSVWLAKIADHSVAQWFGDWNNHIRQAVSTLVTTARAGNQVPVLVLYTIPLRDCGSYSSGGAADADSYRRFVRHFSKGIGNKPAVVIIEPDALGVVECLSTAEQTERYSLINWAVQRLQQQPRTVVYIDAGHPQWVPASRMAKRLQKAGIADADGFTLNVSNFYTTGRNVRYGAAISGYVDQAHFVIDTSRNGQGISDPYEWCNPTERGLGALPTTDTQHHLVDAWLWIKPPGESDGTCNGGPAAGTWWLEYALELARNQ